MTMSIKAPFFKSHPEQYLSGDIIFEPLELQGAFIVAKMYYWANNCNLTYDKMLLRLSNNTPILDILIRKDYLVLVEDRIHIKFLDEQYKEFTEAHEKRVKNGRKGGVKTQKKLNDYKNDNLLRVSDDLKKYLKND